MNVILLTIPFFYIYPIKLDIFHLYTLPPLQFREKAPHLVQSFLLTKIRIILEDFFHMHQTNIDHLLHTDIRSESSRCNNRA